MISVTLHIFLSVGSSLIGDIFMHFWYYICFNVCNFRCLSDSPALTLTHCTPLCPSRLSNTDSDTLHTFVSLRTLQHWLTAHLCVPQDSPTLTHCTLLCPSRLSNTDSDSLHTFVSLKTLQHWLTAHLCVHQDSPTLTHCTPLCPSRPVSYTHLTLPTKIGV